MGFWGTLNSIDNLGSNPDPKLAGLGLLRVGAISSWVNDPKQLGQLYRVVDPKQLGQLRVVDPKLLGRGPKLQQCNCPNPVCNCPNPPLSPSTSPRELGLVLGVGVLVWFGLVWLLNRVAGGRAAAGWGVG